MKRLTLLFPAALLAGVALLSYAQTNLTGYWMFRVPQANNDGTFRDSYFELKQDGAAITGRAIQGARETPISEGTFQGGALHFVVSTPGRGANATPNRTVYDGKLVDGKFTLTSAGRGNPVSGEFLRSSKEAATPPAPLPLPDLHDVKDNGLVRTPPMGWNSWNKFAGRVTDADVRGMADAMVASGMAKAGYVYVNIDDTWEGQSRDANGNITTNRKFPDMKALTAYVHSKGLKIGIYSSPGPKTCAGYEASYGHEEQDAKQFAAWGFDYLKYDWCSAGNIYKDTDMQAVYQKMGDALLKAGRPIVYSLCQYGRSDVWTWGAKVGGNLWRTTGDISDRWLSLDRIGFGPAVPGQRTQLDIASAMKPGHFNDPDMLEIGNGGMTDDEYRLHMSLWSLLSAPLLAGNDLRSMTDEIKSILMNVEVIAVNQDRAVNPPRKISEENGGMSVVLAKTLADGSVAVGLFNRGEEPALIPVSWKSLGIAAKTARDLWTHQAVAVSGDSYTATVPKHGVAMLKVSAK
jgi:alpha-galactosidase